MLNETQRAPPRYKISDFFSSLLVLIRRSGLSLSKLAQLFFSEQQIPQLISRRRALFRYFFSNGYHVTSIPVFTISCVRRAYSVNGTSTYTVATHTFFFPNARLTPPFSIGAN